MHFYLKSIYSSLTFAVKCEKEEEQSSDQVPQESDHSTSDAFRNWIDCLDEELKEYWHTAVDKNAHQDAGSIQDGCEMAKDRAEQQYITV